MLNQDIFSAGLQFHHLTPSGVSSGPSCQDQIWPLSLQLKVTTVPTLIIVE